MKIIVTGCDGYIGYPLLLELVTRKYDSIGVDNLSRREWVERIVGEREHPFGTEFAIYGDLSKRDFMYEILAIHKPDVIIHLASQPSMPYSQINGERALFTQVNNLSMWLNLLWGSRELGLNPRFILTTTTGIPGQYYNSIPESSTLNMAGSWYHVSRGFDSANANLASRQWGFTILEFRTSIVYGIQTELMRKDELITRFDTDSYFGTVLNRFIKQKLDNKPITIYGRGEQTKPFIALEDTVHSLINAIDYPTTGHAIFNQTTETVSIAQLAMLVGGNVKHIPNPRKEDETFKMNFDNKEFLKVLGREPIKMKDELGRMISAVKSNT